MGSRADALALLQMALQPLYEAREMHDGRPVLTFSGYEAMGGLEGAIAAKAEEVLEGPPQAVQKHLPALVVALVDRVTDEDEVIARPLRRPEFAAAPDRTALLDTLAAPGAWLLVAERQDLVRVAHKALLCRWARRGPSWQNTWSGCARGKR
jgi:hypothetical protein